MRRLPAVAAQFAPFPEALDERLTQALTSRGIQQLYTHQAEAIDHALAGRHVVVDHADRLGQDALLQRAGAATRSSRIRRAARSISFRPRRWPRISSPSCRRCAKRCQRTRQPRSACSPMTATRRRMRGGRFDRGRTSCSAIPTWSTRESCRTIRDGRSCSRICKYVVIDELHAYRGVFGSHLCNVLRRLRRICRHYGSNPVFLCSSATIANPRELAERLTEQPFELVERSGAPRGEKFFVFVNPPVVNHQLGIRRSYLGETRRIASEFLKRNLQLIVFAQSRLATEILTTYLKDDFEGVPGGPETIRGYRGGYLPLRRREIEKGLREGVVRAVVSTNALELGIDIGALDVAVLAGYPGTIASTWQRAGRAGRRTSRSAAVMVASSAPLDQFVVRNPSYFFDASPERALIDPDNLHILVDHIKCAAFELPFTDAEEFGRHRPAGNPRGALRAGPRAPVDERRLVVDERIVSGRCGQLAFRLIGQLRRRRHHARSAGDRRNRLHQRADDAASQGDLHRGREALSGGAVRLRRAERRSCARSTATTTRRRSPIEGHTDRHVRDRRERRSRAFVRTARSTSCRAWSVSRRSSSTRTRTSAPASSTCRNSRCTRRPTG